MKYIFLNFILVLISCSTSQELMTTESEVFYPGKSWTQMESLKANGWSSTKLKKARQFSENLVTAAVMIVQNGQVVDEWGATETKYNIHSVRKSLLSGMYGIFEEKGKINLSNTLEELGISDRLGLTDQERQATVEDLMRSRSGVYHPSNYVTVSNSARWPARGSHAPGTHWFYSNWDFNALGTIFEKQSGLGIFDAFNTLIAQPIGMQDFLTSDGMYEPRSNFNGAQGKSVSDHPAYVFRLTARDMARFGLLYLRKGAWLGNQIIPQKWIEKTTQTNEAVGRQGEGYEYLWWIGIDGKLFPNVKLGKGAFAARGHGGHFITIVPEKDLVIVHRVDTNSRNATVGGVELGQSIELSDYGKLLAMILDSYSH